MEILAISQGPLSFPAFANTCHFIPDRLFLLCCSYSGPERGSSTWSPALPLPCHSWAHPSPVLASGEGVVKQRRKKSETTVWVVLPTWMMAVSPFPSASGSTCVSPLPSGNNGSLLYVRARSGGDWCSRWAAGISPHPFSPGHGFWGLLAALALGAWGGGAAAPAAGVLHRALWPTRASRGWQDAPVVVRLCCGYAVRMLVILMPLCLLADSNVRAWSRWLVWVGEGGICSGAALGWAGCPEEALWSKDLWGGSRAAKVHLPGPTGCCMRCPLEIGPWRGAGGALAQGLEEPGLPWGNKELRRKPKCSCVASGFPQGASCAVCGYLLAFAYASDVLRQHLNVSPEWLKEAVSFLCTFISCLW